MSMTPSSNPSNTDSPVIPYERNVDVEPQLPGEQESDKVQTKSVSRWTDWMFFPPLFLYFFGNNMISTPLTNLLMERTCLYNMNVTSEVCSNLKNFSDIENQVQVATNNINLYSTLIKTLPAACLAVFFGPWSDKYGRKLPIYLSVVGTMLTDVGVIIYGAVTHAPTFTLWLSSLFTGISGGGITFLGCTYSLAADNTEHKHRTRRYAFMQIGVAMGAPLGGLLGGYILDSLGYTAVFGLSVIAHTAVAVYVFFVIKDESARQQAPIMMKLKDLFTWDNFRENLKVASRRRENRGTVQLWLLIISSAIIFLNFSSIYDIMYVFCHKMYRWSVSQYSLVMVIYANANVGVLVVAIPLLIRVWKVPDAWLGLLGTASLLVENAIKAFAYREWIFYVALVSSVFGGIAPFAVRARLSKSVQDDELGKVFAVVAAVESLAPIPGSLLFVGVYNASISFFTGLVFLVSAATLLFPLGTFIWLLFVSPSNTYKYLKEKTNDILFPIQE